jgi:hypothetical protein
MRHGIRGAWNGGWESCTKWRWRPGLNLQPLFIWLRTFVQNVSISTISLCNFAFASSFRVWRSQSDSGEEKKPPIAPHCNMFCMSSWHFQLYMCPQCAILLGLFPLSIVNWQLQWAHMVLKISISPQWHICHKESEQKENLIIPLIVVLFGMYFATKTHVNSSQQG